MTFQELFERANLTTAETQYFLADAQDAKNNIEFETAKDYYSMKETQFCIIKYAMPEWQEVAKSGLEKILNVIK